MSLLNRKQVKAYALEASKVRARKFTRVSQSFYDQCEGQLRRFIQDYVRRMPSKGTTIR